jgi:transposase-like protein
MAKYSEEFKLSIIKQMLHPENKKVIQISKETGIAEQTLYKWKRQAKAKGIVITDGDVKAENWSTQDKFMIVVETASLNKTQLSEYCRKKGLYTEQVEAWRDACMQANGGVAEESLKLTKANKEKDKAIKKLEKELKQKEAALAETAALIVLRKKAHAIWGDPEDE